MILFWVALLEMAPLSPVWEGSEGKGRNLMDGMPTILLLAMILGQQPEEAHDLVGKLRSQSVEERAEATRKLKVLGKAAVPELTRAVGDADSEVASRARLLLRHVEVRDL